MSKKPTEVRDLDAEKGIKWGVFAQTLIAAAIVGTAGLGISFGERIIDGMDKLNASLVDIRKEISLVNTRGILNDSRLNKHEQEISRNTENIEKLYGRKY